MASRHVAQTSDRRTRERREPSSADGVALGARHLSWLPLTLVILSLAGLAIAPLVLQQRTENLRTDLRSAAEPGRMMLGELRLGLAHELSVAQRFALSGASSDWFAYHRAVATDDSLLSRLDVMLRGLGLPARQSLAGVKETVSRWRRMSAVEDGASSPSLLRDAVQRGVSYEDLLSATTRVDSAVANAMQYRRARIEQAETLELRIAITFVLIGVIASAAVLVLTLRDRHLRQVLRRRAEEEASLRRLAGSLSGAFTVDEVGALTVAAALNSSRVGGAYLTRAIDGNLVTVAGRGTLAPVAGTRSPLPPWLDENIDRNHPRIFTTEVRPAPDPLHAGNDRRKSGTLLVVPLRHNGDIIGTLGIASAGGRRQLGESALRFGRALGDLAAVALHRAEALENERRARAVAESAVRTRDAVVSIVSHDLRNPLMAILGSADLLLEFTREGQSELARSQLMMLKHAADTMNRLIRDLLDVTRLESGPLPVQRRRLNLIEVVDDVLSMFQVVARARHLTLVREIPAEAPIIHGDRDRLGQALANLISNAVKFTPEGGQIHVSLDVQPRCVRACVRDTGPGIPNDAIPHLFDRFWQASRHDARGLGLGLTIAKAIIDAHDGSIAVESAPNRGTAFRVTLPRGETNVAATPVTQQNILLPAEPASPTAEQLQMASIFAGVTPPLQ
jgi:signal transduction histidine kinase